jgi:hypothetical protein
LVAKFLHGIANNIETYPYKVDQNTILEIRTYEATLFTSVQLSINKESSSKGFSILAGYILLETRKRKIAMTSPVSMSLDSSMTMMFMVPKSLKKKRYHNQTDLILNSEKNLQKLWQLYPAGGWADDEKIASYKQRNKSVGCRRIKYTNPFYTFWDQCSF